MSVEPLSPDSIMIEAIQLLRECAFHGNKGTRYSSHALNVEDEDGRPTTIAHQQIYSIVLHYGDQIVSTVITVTTGAKP